MPWMYILRCADNSYYVGQPSICNSAFEITTTVMAPNTPHDAGRLNLSILLSSLTFARPMPQKNRSKDGAGRNVKP